MAQRAKSNVKSQTGEERRIFPRTRFETSVNLTSPSNFYTGLTQDISEGGIFVETYLPLTFGSVVDLQFSLPDEGPPITVQAEVRWISEYNPNSDGNPGVGLRFLQLEKKDRVRIEAFVQRRETIFYEE
jgi:uncharacterized protein (TIGR02266 family)